MARKIPPAVRFMSGCIKRRAKGKPFSPRFAKQCAIEWRREKTKRGKR